MRHMVRRHREDDEQESSFVSMTDLTVSFLFIVMLLMAFFATRYADETPDPLEEYLKRAAAARLQVLESLREGIKAEFPNLVVQISAQGDALQFQGEGLFGTNESELEERPRRIVRTIARTLDEVLPCYTTGRHQAWREDCNRHFALIDAVQIEGHTDNQGAEMGNLMLSTARANVTFEAMIGHRRSLTEHRNLRGFPVLSVAGYGWMRPVATNGTEDGRGRNRRIDLRIIMYAPVGQEEVERVIEGLRGELAQA